MSKVGFRRELLGFNRDDVLNYLKKSQSEFNERETELLNNIDKLNSRNSKLIDEISKIPELEAKLKLSENTISNLQEELASLEETRLQNERISKDIARTYLVSRSNADAVNRAAKESSERTFYEVEKTLSSLELIQQKINEIKDTIEQASNDYSQDLKSTEQSLEEAKRLVLNAQNEVKTSNEKVVSKQ